MFHAISYLVDTYRNNQLKHPGITNTFLYFTFYPKIISGPILLQKDFESQTKDHTITSEKIINGIQLFIIGLSKKTIIADSIAPISNEIFSLNHIYLTPSIAWVGIVLYSLQIYFDFSGYSDMAIGIGKMFGYELPKNFNFPYISKNITEFWRRWHISLSSWFKEYIYIPLGGSRVSRTRNYINIFIVFLITGIWHGANWTFIVWGLWHGMFMIIERFLKNKNIKIPAIIDNIYLLTIVLIGWVFFRSDSLSSAMSYVGTMFNLYNGQKEIIFSPTYFLNTKIIIILLIGIAASTPLFDKIIFDINNRNIFTRTIKFLMIPIMLIASMIFIANTTYSPFIYSQF